jgi:hypothetical protein
MMGQGLLGSSSASTGGLSNTPLPSLIQQQQQQQQALLSSASNSVGSKPLVNGLASATSATSGTVGNLALSTNASANPNLIQDQYGLLGLIDVIRMTNEDLSTLALGIF